MSIAGNERLKHTASWLNGLATALIAAGAFAPTAALLYGLSTPSMNAMALVIIIPLCIGLGLALHLSGRALLGRLLN
jgi:hypothetical protein